VDRAGRILGSHQGVHRFTVGQRRGLGLTGRRPLYVLAVRPDSATVVAGEADELEAARLTAREVNWIAGPPAGPTLRAAVKIRYRHAESPATLRVLSGDRVEVAFDAPQRAVTPGQAAVFYDGDVCLGGGWIE
jgi:tRNA-specific 2-thiouridylase